MSQVLHKVEVPITLPASVWKTVVYKSGTGSQSRRGEAGICQVGHATSSLLCWTPPSTVIASWCLNPRSSYAHGESHQSCVYMYMCLPKRVLTCSCLPGACGLRETHVNIRTRTKESKCLCLCFHPWSVGLRATRWSSECLCVFGVCLRATGCTRCAS